MLKWCIIGSGDVVERLVGNSLNIKNNSKIISILSDNTDQARKVANKIDVKEIYLASCSSSKEHSNVESFPLFNSSILDFLISKPITSLFLPNSIAKGSPT